jgi:site-specific DNA-methyltransferase (adenine-specific)
MKNIENLFNQFLDCVQTLQTALNVNFSDALTETFDNLETGRIKVEMGAPDQKSVAILSKKYAQLHYDQLSKKAKSTVFTLLTLKAINDDGRDVNQMPTPPIISTIIALLVRKFVKKTDATILDPAIGSGSLLFSVVNQLISSEHSQNKYQLEGIDNDEGMLAFADIAAHLQDLKIELYCQDALQPWLCKQPDLIISDLPVGYYPLDNNAAQFENRSKKGHSIAHLLFIEQIIRNLKADAYAFLVVPNGIMSGQIGADFMPWLGKKAYLQAIIELPDKMFKNKFNQKSILVIQNHGEHARSHEVLLTKLANLNQEESLLRFNVKLNEWYTKNYK